MHLKLMENLSGECSSLLFLHVFPAFLGALFFFPYNFLKFLFFFNVL